MVLTVNSRTQTEFIDITSEVGKSVRSSGITRVRTDILMILNQLVPWKAPYRHNEGNSPAHIKSTLVGVSQTVPVKDGRLVLGTWQGIFFCEFDGPRTRKVHISINATAYPGS